MEINNTNPDEIETEEIDVETLEFSIDDEDIEELIEKLQTLRETKSFIFEVDEGNELQINYEDSLVGEDDDEEDAGGEVSEGDSVEGGEGGLDDEEEDDKDELADEEGLGGGP